MHSPFWLLREHFDSKAFKTVVCISQYFFYCSVIFCHLGLLILADTIPIGSIHSNMSIVDLRYGNDKASYRDLVKLDT